LSWRKAAVSTDLDIADVRACCNTSNRLRVYRRHLINRAGRSAQGREAPWTQTWTQTQTRALLAQYQAFRQSEPQTPVVWLGDFNALGDLLHLLRPERSIVELPTCLRLFLEGCHPTQALLKRTDWVFGDRLLPLRSRVGLLPYPDRFPVVAEY